MRHPIARLLVLFLLMLLAVGPPALGFDDEPEAPGLPAGRVDCPTCDAGVVTRMCAACGGVGELPCVGCRRLVRGFYDVRPAWNVLVQLSEEGETSLNFLLAKTEKVAASLGSAGGRTSCCGGPVLAAMKGLLVDGLQCKRCKGRGGVDCPTCKAGVQSCGACRGKGIEEGACRDCSGLGHLPDPMAGLDVEDPGAADSCGWCEGSGLLPCPDLVGNAHLKHPKATECRVCFGKKKLACAVCAGTKKLACSTCGGFGQIVKSQVFGKPPKLARCKTCGGKGLEKCSNCKGKGSTKCEHCKGRGKLGETCTQCDDTGLVPCAGCFRSSPRYWEVTGGMLTALGEEAAAALFWSQVPKRLGAHQAEREDFENAWHFDYVLGRPSDEGEIAIEHETRRKVALAHVPK